MSASTYDLHYDQKRNACWWTTGDLVQTGEGGEVQEEMEEGQQMESGVEGAGSVEVRRQADSGDRRLRGRIYFFLHKFQSNKEKGENKMAGWLSHITLSSL